MVYTLVMSCIIFENINQDYKIDDMKISSFMISVPDGSEIGLH